MDPRYMRMNDTQLANYANRVADRVLGTTSPDDESLLELSEAMTEQAERAIADEDMAEAARQYALQHDYILHW